MKKLHSILSNYSTLLMMIAGIYFGIYHKDAAIYLVPIGDIYLKLLQLTVIPIVILTVAFGVFEIKNVRRLILYKLSKWTFIVVFLSAIIPICFVIFLQPWKQIVNLSDYNSLFADPEILKPLQLGIYDSIQDPNHANLSGLFAGMFPENIFKSLVNFNMLQVVVGTLIISTGIIARSNENSYAAITARCKFTFEVFEIINDFIIKFMPMGIFFVMSNQFLYLDFYVLKALGILIITIVSCLCAQIICYSIIICVKTKISPIEFVRAYFKTFVIIFSTRSSIIALPSSMDALRRIKLDEKIIGVYMPLGSSLIRIGTMTFFAVVTLFIMGMFGVEITFSSVIFITFSSMLAALSTVGTTGIVSLQMIAIVLNPLGLPLGGVMAILIAIDTIVDVFDTLSNVMGNSAVIALSCDKKK